MGTQKVIGSKNKANNCHRVENAKAFVHTALGLGSCVRECFFDRWGKYHENKKSLSGSYKI